MTPNVGAVSSDVTGIYDVAVFGYDIYKAWWQRQRQQVQ